MAIGDPIYGEALSIADIAAHSRDYGPIVEILNKRNPILKDIRMVRCNNGTSHKGIIRTSLPDGTFKGFYQGVNSEKATVVQIEEPTKMLQSIALADCDLIDLNENIGNALLQQNKGFIAGLGQHQARTLFYGDENQNPNVYNGLASRYNAYGDNPKFSSYNVINAGGTGTNLTSIYIVGWGDDKVCGIYPANSVAGLQHRDLGADLVPDSAGRLFRAYRHHYSWSMGLFVADWRYCIRIANIDIAQFANWGTSAWAGPDLGTMIIQALGMKFPDNTPDGSVMYCSRDVWTMFQIMARDKGNLALSLRQWNGETIDAVNGMPLRICESISTHETVVPAA